MGTLFVVATPIGNIADISIRALEVLSGVQYIACEDTRRTGQLLQTLSKRYSDIIGKFTTVHERPHLISYFEHNEIQRIPSILNVLQNGEDVALVSDAGTPTISDPGFKLLRECVAKGITIVTIPGPSAVIAALSISGLPTDKFCFLGYLPHKQGNRVRLLENTKESLGFVKQTVIFYEAPHKILKSLTDVEAVFGDIDIVVCRELTKVHEEVRREKISKTLKHFSKTEPLGEFTILFNLSSE